MIKKKLGKILFAWDPTAFNGKGYWYVAGKNDSLARAATKMEASKLGKPKDSEMPPKDVEKQSSIPGRKPYFTTDKRGRPIRRYTATESQYEQADITRSKSLSQLATEKLLSGESLGGSIKGAIGSKTKAIATSASKLLDPMSYLSKIPGIGQLAAGYYGKKRGRSAEDIAYFTGVRGSATPGDLVNDEEMESDNMASSEEQQAETSKIKKVQHDELVEAIKKTYKWGEEGDKKKEDEEGGILSSLMSFLPTMTSVLGSLSGLLPALGTVASGLLAFGGARAIDAGLGKLGVGKDEKGKDLVIDDKADDANWEKMNWWEKIQSGAGRGIEKVGGVISPNLARQAEFDRIKSESEWLKDKEKDDANWEKMNWWQKIESGVGRGIEQVGGVVAPGMAKKAKESRIADESAYLSGKKQKTSQKIMTETSSQDISGITMDEITSHPNFKKHYEQATMGGAFIGNKSGAWEEAKYATIDDIMKERASGKSVASVSPPVTQKIPAKSTDISGTKTADYVNTNINPLYKKPTATPVNKKVRTAEQIEKEIQTIENSTMSTQMKNARINDLHRELFQVNTENFHKSVSNKLSLQPSAQKLASRMNESTKENLELSAPTSMMQSPTIVNAPKNTVVNNSTTSGGTPAKLRNDEPILTRLQYQNVRPI